MRPFSFIPLGLALAISASARARPPGSSASLITEPGTTAPDGEASNDPANPLGKEIAEVKFSGLRRVEADAIRAVLHLKEGAILSRTNGSEELKAIFGMGYFVDGQMQVEVRPDGKLTLTYLLTEKPALRKVLYEGNAELSADDLKELVDLKSYAILDQAAVRRNQHKIHDKYVEKGFYLADVGFRLTPAPGNEVDVVFVVAEHAKVQVRSVQFVGNRRVSSGDLAGSMLTKPGNWLSFLGSDGTYREEMLEHDVSAIQGVYFDRGFINVRVQKPRVELSPDKRFMYISLRIDEGEQFRVGSIEFSGDQLLAPADMRRRVSLGAGELFSRSKLVRDIQALTDVAQDRGYAYANVTPQTAINEEQKTIDVTFDTQKGKLVYIERIEIGGNTKTRDKVIRRELRIYEGDLLSGVVSKLSKQRVSALGYFESVEISTKRGSADDLVLVTVQVKERPTGTFQVGAGFSTLENFIFTAQLSQNNLFGWGQTGALTLQLSSLRQLVQLQFVDNYFLDTKFTFAADVFRNQIGQVSFVRSATGGDVTFGYPLSEVSRGTFLPPSVVSWLEDARLFLTYTAQDVGVTSVYQGTDQVLNSNQYITYVLSSLRLSLTIDKRNDRLYPSNGYMISQSVEVAPAWLGSGFEFARFSGYFRYYHPLFAGLVFKTNWTYGILDAIDNSPIPQSERFYVGGINSVRGYYLYSVSPTKPVAQRTPDSVTSDTEYGGNKQLIINNEIEFPIVEKIQIRGVLFYDLGNAFSESENFFQDKQYPNLPLGLLHSVGFGVRWFSPIGPLRFEWGFPLTPRPKDGPYDFEFTIGNFF